MRSLGVFLRTLALPEQSRILLVGPVAEEMRLTQEKEWLRGGKVTCIDPHPLPFASEIHPPHRFLQMDLTRLTFSDQCFDLILCNHVLPYIRSDYLAMSEIHRCLKDEGVALLNVRLDLTKTERAWGEGEAEHRPGDPVWRYGADYFERLEAAGFFIHRLLLSDFVSSYAELGLNEAEEFFLCFKFGHVRERFLASLGRA